jgi:membrane-bound lytic murein transglycosylase A
MFTRLRLIPLILALLLGGCAVAPTPPLKPVTPPPTGATPTAPSPAVLKPADWPQLPGWAENDALAAWPAFLVSCGPLKKQAAWQNVCAAATKLSPQDDAGARAFFEQWLIPQQLLSAEGDDTGLITGYYEPLLLGSRTSSARYRFPLYGMPDDLLTIDLASLYPELKKYRLRGRLNGNRIVPYYSRADIEAGKAPLQNKAMLWVDDAVDLFFLQIQGSGRVQLENGEVVRMGYADQNGYPYASIGKKLVEQGELALDQASMQGIKQWGLRNPEKLPALLDSNASYVFFRELPPSPNGPPGALGVPLTGGHSLAVDPRAIALGSPVYLATTWPNSTQALNRLMLAQDTGGAIKGAVRADFFWGFGEEAAKHAGSMRQAGRMWVLLPKGTASSPLD